jgi:hypothetical protein
LAENIPLLEQYQALFHKNQYVVGALSQIYTDILEFHGAALRIFKQRSEVTNHNGLFLLTAVSVASTISLSMERLQDSISAYPG